MSRTAPRPQLWWYNALRLAMAGAEAPQIAAQLGLGQARVTTFLRSAWAQEEARALHAAVMQKAEREAVDPLIRFHALLDRAITTLEAKLSCADDRTAFFAACRIIDQAGLTITKRIAISEDDTLKQLTREEMQCLAETGRLPQRLQPLNRAALAIAASLDGADGSDAAAAD